MPDSRRRPDPRRGWRRKREVDARAGRRLPIPVQVVSNEEFAPLPQTRAQAAVERRLLEIAGEAARRRGIDRRRFLASAGGMAAAFLALNDVFGRFFAVEAAEPTAEGAGPAIGDFVLDVQVHFVDVRHDAPAADLKFREYLIGVRRLGRNWNPALKDRAIAKEELYRETFITEVFLDSDTDLAMISGLPQMTSGTYVLTPEEMARTTSWVNEAAGSRRVLSQGVLSPELGARNLEAVHAQAERHRVVAWKGYPGKPLGPDGSRWWLDDEKVAYPALEAARKLGVRIVAVHKGLPAPGFSAEHCHPKDVMKAAKDFPDFKFLVYHAGLKGIDRPLVEAAQGGFESSAAVPWISESCAWRKANPEVKNVWMDLGSTFGMTAITMPALCAHMLGMMIDAFGEDGVLWGTDAIWWGSPQWQFEALRRFEMPESLSKRFGWKPLTPGVKAKILGLNAAQVFGIDPQERRNALPADAIGRLKKACLESGEAAPSLTQLGWVRSS